MVAALILYSGEGSGHSRQFQTKSKWFFSRDEWAQRQMPGTKFSWAVSVASTSVFLPVASYSRGSKETVRKEGWETGVGSRKRPEASVLLEFRALSMPKPSFGVSFSEPQAPLRTSWSSCREGAVLTPGGVNAGQTRMSDKLSWPWSCCSSEWPFGCSSRILQRKMLDSTSMAFVCSMEHQSHDLVC